MFQQKGETKGKRDQNSFTYSYWMMAKNDNDP